MVFNFFMLLFGFLGEIGVLNRHISLILGTIFFLLSVDAISLLGLAFRVLGQRSSGVSSVDSSIFFVKFALSTSSYSVLNACSVRVLVAPVRRPACWVKKLSYCILSGLIALLRYGSTILESLSAFSEKKILSMSLYCLFYFLSFLSILLTMRLLGESLCESFDFPDQSA